MEATTEVKCDTCGQTLFFKRESILEVKCRRCKGIKKVALKKLLDWIEDVLKI